jgi:sugar phosphate isomerase/epimerase
MNVAVSNIAWPVEQDAAVADALAALGVSGVEIAPTKVWPAPLEATDAQIDAYRKFWAARGISIVAAQALLFGRPDLTLFESADARARTLEYLGGIVRVCARAGARALVFGSPKNRRVGTRGRVEVWPEAIEFFGRLGELAAAAGTVVVMEANPPEYGADFVTRAGEALDLVRAVNHPGFRLHLDTACMTMANDDAAAIIPSAVPFLSHVHASEPHLAPVGGGAVDHRAFSALLAAGYGGWVSIEMRQVDPFDIGRFKDVVRCVRATY